MAQKRTTVADLEDRMNGMEGLLNGIAGKLGIGPETDDTPAPEPSETAAPAETQAKQTRKVVLPDLQTFEDDKRGLGVDGTYKENIAIFKLRDDGTPVCKRDGGVKKPTRLRVEDAEFILRHPDEVSALCTQIREMQTQATQASATE